MKDGWIEILLGAASVALMAVTALAAFGAIIGWTLIQSKAVEAAEKAAGKAMDNFLEKENIREMLRKRVEQEAAILYGEMEKSPTHDLTRNVTESKAKETKNG